MSAGMPEWTPSQVFNRAMILLGCPVRAVADEPYENTWRRLDRWVDEQIGQCIDVTVNMDNPGHG